MATYISFQPSDNFSTKLYTGNGTAIGSGGLAVTGVGFQPDFTWIKNRDTSDNHQLFDAPRGATDIISSNSAAVESTETESLTTWGADGFTLGNLDTVNTNAEDYVSWNWKGGTTAVPSGGSITPTACSFNATTGFGIYAYPGNATSGATIAHGLGVAPQMIIIKALSTGESWSTYHIATNGGTDPEDYVKILDTNVAKSDNAGYWNDTKPDATYFTLGNSSRVNGSGENYIAYVFAPVTGFSHMSDYRGNNNAEGAFAYCGFKPAFVMIKSDESNNWVMWDDKRGFNGALNISYPNDTAAEATSDLDLLSNGFKIRNTTSDQNASGQVFTFLAMAEFPSVSSNDIPGVAR